MKKMLAWLLTLLLLLEGSIALAESPVTLTVGTTTAMSGSFMSGLFGINTADIDARRLLHGHSLIHFDPAQGTYLFDRTVVTESQIAYEDGVLRYELTLNPRLRYSDGSPITAEDYAFSLMLSISPEIRALGGSTLAAESYLGGAAYGAGQTDTLQGLHIRGDHSLTILVSSSHTPNFYALSLLDVVPFPISEIAPGCRIVSSYAGCTLEGLTVEGLQKTLLDPETGYVTHPTVVSGPYTLASWDAENSVAVFEKNPCYLGNPDGETPSIPRIVYRLVSNEEAPALLSDGSIDLMHKAMDPTLVASAQALAAEGRLASIEYPRSGLGFISFSCEQPAVGSAAVRQAIAHCFDKQAFISGVLGEGGEAVDGWYGLGQWIVKRAGTRGLAGLTRYPLDAASAAALLEKDGWTLNADGLREKEIGGETVALSLRLIYPEGSEAGRFLSNEFAAALREVGIALDAQALPFTELLRVYYRQDARDVDMIYLASNFGTVFDPSAMFDPADAEAGLANRTAIQDAELYRLAVELRRTQPGDSATYCERWIRMQERWTEVLPCIPVYSNIYFDFFTPALTGYQVVEGQTWAEGIVGAELNR